MLKIALCPSPSTKVSTLRRVLMISDEVLSTGAGYQLLKAFNHRELTWFTDYITSKMRVTLLEQTDLSQNDINSVSLSNYHAFASRVDHKNIWKRDNRLFCDAGISFLTKTSFFEDLVNRYGSVRVTNEIHGKDPEIVWRLVRPNEPTDIGPIHADKWFWDLNGWLVNPGQRLIKIWVLLQGSSGNGGGLLVNPHSQTNSEQAYSIVEADGIRKPKFDLPGEDIRMENLASKPGDAVAFSYQLLHAGGITVGDKCRVSMEFTLEVPKEAAYGQ